MNFYFYLKSLEKIHYLNLYEIFLIKVRINWKYIQTHELHEPNTVQYYNIIQKVAY